MKRIINGKTYNTETAVKLYGYDGTDLDPHDSLGPLWGEILYQNRYGAYFLFKYDERPAVYEERPEIQIIQPLSPSEAQNWLENIQHTNLASLIEAQFGEMPEAGDAESRLTLRMPDSLKIKIDHLASQNKQSTNAWIVKTLEKAIAYERG